MKKVSLIIVIFILLAVYSARANGENNNPNMIGLGIAVVDLPYKGTDSSIIPVPIIYFEQGNFFLRGLKTGFSLYKDDTFEIYTLIAGRIAGYDSGDSDDLAGMDDRRWSLDGGMEFKWNLPYCKNSSLSLSILHDLLSRYKGSELEARFAKLFEARPLFVKPSLGISWQSNEFVRYYYGVKDSEQISGRPSYSPGSALNYIAALDTYLYFSPQWALILRTECSFLDDEIKKSPIVDRDYALNFVFGITRKF